MRISDWSSDVCSSDLLHCVVDLGAAGDHFSLRVVAVQQFGDPYLTDVLAAVAWTAGPRMPDTALVPDNIQHLPDLGAVGLPDADHESLVPLLQQHRNRIVSGTSVYGRVNLGGS